MTTTDLAPTARAHARVPRLDHSEQELLEEGRPRRPLALHLRERHFELAAAATFLLVASALLVAFPPRGADWLLAGALTGAFALLSRVEYQVSACYAVPTELALVPMLLLLPPSLVPPLVALAYTLAKLDEYGRRSTHPGRVVLNLGDAWHAVGPALVLAATHPGGPDWSDWPIYLAALAAQLACDFGAMAVRERGARDTPLRRQLPGFAQGYALDLLLAPVGLLAAMGAQSNPYAVLLVLPLGIVFVRVTRERDARILQATELSRAYRGTARLLADMLEYSSRHTGEHSRDVVSLAAAVADELGVGPEERHDVEFTALLHDVGKIAIPRELVEKPGPLTPDEWTTMRGHTLEGQRMLEQVGGALAAVGFAVRASHERWDGGGYPDGLAGEQIPLGARIISVADAFDAMVTARPYSEAVDPEEALAEIRRCSGTQFDPQVVAVMDRTLCAWDASHAPTHAY